MKVAQPVLEQLEQVKQVKQPEQTVLRHAKGSSVLVAMSGGVDSSVAAALLLDSGYEVTGVTMKLWGGESDTGCCSVSDVDDARWVANQLGIEHHVFNFGDDFDRHVVTPYVADHTEGRTPNPCVECNRWLKFRRLLHRAEALGFDAVATGHHARVVATKSGLRLARGADMAKDQSYVLHMLKPSVLDKVLFPVGHMKKTDVRAVAQERGLVTASKRDSQGVCFITNKSGRQAFLGERIPLKPGRVVDKDGEVLSTLQSVELVTLGQRKGLGLPGGGDARYVLDIDVDTSTVLVGSGEDINRAVLPLEQWSWVDMPVTGTVSVQTSAHGVPHAAQIVEDGVGGGHGASHGGGCVDGDGGAKVLWHSPQRAIASGQSVVAYLDDVVVGGGVAARSRFGKHSNPDFSPDKKLSTDKRLNPQANVFSSHGVARC